MNIEDLTIAQARELTALFAGNCSKPSPFEVGKKYLIRTVTHIDVGEVVSIVGDFVIMRDASWIADTGRFHECLSRGTFGEIEPYTEDAIINASAIIDASEWNHELPKEQK